MNIRILEAAIEDLERASGFYEKQEEGIGSYFMDSLFSEIDSLKLFGGMHRQVFGFQRLLARRFPYAIYYQVRDSDTVIVWRVLDLRQHPEKLRTELE